MPGREIFGLNQLVFSNFFLVLMVLGESNKTYLMVDLLIYFAYCKSEGKTNEGRRKNERLLWFG